MRLLNTSRLQLKLFVDERGLPEFAILSHRWLDVEALFNDVEALGESTPQRLLEQCDSGLHGEKALSWSKICQACIVAEGQGYNYIWIDTCCIDKSSSSELSEAINSMFRWYETSAICYVYLQDVTVTYSSQADQAALDVFDEQFRRSAWFERGWTLQELLAPKKIQFFNYTWQELGAWASKEFDNVPTSLQEDESQEKSSAGDEFDHVFDLVASRTRIPKNILTHEKPLAHISVGARLSWAAGRTTTRVEDEAYSLLGIFGINMSLLYGEGKNAFARLQREIMLHITDQTILAWSSTAVETEVLARERHDCTILAPSVANFAACGPLIAFRNTNVKGSHRLLKHGLRVFVELLVGMGEKYSGHVYRIRRSNEMDILEIEKGEPRPRHWHTIEGVAGLLEDEHADQEVTPIYPQGEEVKIAFAVLDCFRSDQPWLYPAIRLAVISWERREFALSRSRQLVYLRPSSSHAMWLECVETPQHRPVTINLFNKISSGFQTSNARRMFPAVREQQTVVILDRTQMSRPAIESHPFRLSISYANELEEKDGLQLRQSWPADTWDLQRGIANFKMDLPARKRFILQLTGTNGSGIYILLKFDNGLLDRHNPGPNNPVLYLARCDAEHNLTNVLRFLDYEDDQERSEKSPKSRTRDHIHIGRFRNKSKFGSFRVDVSINNAQIGHSGSGTEIRVNVKSSLFGSSDLSGTLSSLTQYCLYCLILVFAICAVCFVLAASCGLEILFLSADFIKHLWNKYRENRERYRYR